VWEEGSPTASFYDRPQDARSGKALHPMKGREDSPTLTLPMKGREKPHPSPPRKGRENSPVDRTKGIYTRLTRI
jgi:hypothetical protein